MTDRKNRPSQTQSPTMFRKWGFPVAVIVVAALLVALILATQGSKESDSTASSNQVASENNGNNPQQEKQKEQLRKLVKREDNNPTALGDKNAPVGMVVFSDAQCPYCAKWVTETLPELQHYIDEGQLRVEWHDAVIYGEDSERGAQATHAAGKQGKFEEFVKKLFAGADKASKQTLSTSGLKGVADELGLDVDRFEKDLNSEQVKEEVSKSAQLARQLGLSGTPAFIIDGQPVMGAQPTNVFTQIIDQALAGHSASHGADKN